ncbi:hypothetical protein MAR_026736, partial [Mya arenaria]
PVSSESDSESEKPDRLSLFLISCSKGRVCKLLAQHSDNVLISGTQLGDHPTRKLEAHVSGKYHTNSMTKYVSVNSMGTKAKKTVAEMLTENRNAKKEGEVETNRNYMKWLIKLGYFIVTNHWALNSFEPMLDFMLEMQPPDVVKYRESSASTFKYDSASIVSDIVTSINYTIERETLKQVREAPYFSLIADESSDEAKKSRLLFLCVTHTNRFLGIIHVKQTDATSLMEAVESFLNEKDVDIKKAYFVGFDG